MLNTRIILCFLLLFSLSASSQSINWIDVAKHPQEKQLISVSKFRSVSVDFQSLKNHLSTAPDIRNTSLRDSRFTFEIPSPDGGFFSMTLVESSVMAPELQSRYPEIRTFAGQGTGEYRDATIRLDYTLKGFHAQVILPGKTFYIDPYSEGDLNTYIVYSRDDFFKTSVKQMPECNVLGESVVSPPSQNNLNPQVGSEVPFLSNITTNGTQLRTYRLALACTGEYASFQGGTVPLVMSAMTTTMNRVNGVFLRDVSLQMIMVANNDDLIYLNSATDPYTNNNGSTMLSQNKTTCNNVIGSSNYDIGHVFSTGGGGVAYLGSACGISKAGGVTGGPSPVGDPFDIDYVAHEMGHQWGANHSFNNSCSGNRNSSTAYEPGSGSTIMGYAGVCPPNLQLHSDAYFHNISYTEIINFSVNGGGNSCAVITSTENTPPTISVPVGGFSIPIGTPFELTASASDADGDAITYCWEQFDLGPATSGGDGTLTNPSGNAPIFRSWDPTDSPTRVFPMLSSIINNAVVFGEILPTYSRNLTFRCTVRDNVADGGGVTDGEVAFQATSSSGPFIVTAPNTAVNWTGNSTKTVSWDVANTNTAPVNCTNVDIFLSTDGGYTYPYTLLTNAPNNGSASVIIPNIPTSSARIKVKASNNIFFDISNQNFTIQPGSVYEYDVAFAGVSEPSGDVCGTQITPQISFLNLGSATLTSLQILYNINGGSNSTYNWTGSLNTGASTTITLPVISVTPGAGSLNIILQNPNNHSDGDIINNSGSQNFNVIELTGAALPVSNSFESTFPGTGWTIDNPDLSYTWTSSPVNNDVNCNSGTAASINYNFYSSSGATDDLISPDIDLAGSVSPNLTFDYSYARYSSNYYDRMQVQVLPGCSSEWVTLWDKEGLELATASDYTGTFSPGCGDWSSETIDLSAYSGSVIQIRFRGISGYGNKLYLDNINVLETAAANNPPVAVNDSYTTGFNEALTVNATSGLLANDSDPDGDPISILSASSAEHGTLDILTDGSFTYTPNDGYSGIESITYIISDGYDTDEGTLIITIEANNPPVAVNDSYTTGFNVPLTVNATSGLLANDSDPDGDPISILSASSAEHGTLDILTDGSFTFTPNDGYSGIETITYIISDGYDTDEGTLIITIEANNPPVAVNDSYTTGFNEALTVNATSGLLANDSDPDGDPISILSASSAEHGTLDILTDGSFTYNPNEGYSGIETITYIISDGYDTDEGTLIITIEENPNNPPIAIDDSYTTGFNQTLTANATSGLLANDSDPDGDPITVTIVSGETLGSLNVSSDGSFVYIPDNGASGVETIEYTISDGYAVASATLTITIIPNQPPIAQNDSYTTGFNQTLTVNATSGLLANDSDPDGDPITVTIVSGEALGSLNVSSDGSFVYVPNDGASGVETIVYTISDGYAVASATLTITITANQLPIAQDDSYTTGFNQTLTVNATSGLLANDSDPDGDPITVTIVSGETLGSLNVSSDGSFVYVPNDGASGVETIDYTISDGYAVASATLTITIIPNQPPIAQNDSYTTGFNQTLTVNAASGLLANDSDPDGDPITVTIVSGETLGSLNVSSDGSFVYVPDDGASGVETIDYTISDGYAVASATLTITITANQPPIAQDDSYVTGFNQTLTVNAISGLLANDSDPDGDPISVTIVSGETLGSLNVSSDGSFVYVPDDGASGVETIDYTISDGYAIASATLTITIQPMIDCEGVVNGTSVPGAFCDANGIPGIYGSDCNCEPIPAGSLNGDVSWTEACGERAINIKLFNQNFPELNYTFNTTIDAAGNFSTPDFPSGTYNVLIKVNGYLAKLYPDVSITAGITALSVDELMPGDINGDNAVTILDVSYLSSSFGSTTSDPAYNYLTDFNCDGVINILDISIFTPAFSHEGDVNE